LRVWWKWHDGAALAGGDDDENLTDIGPGGFPLLSLAQALDEYELNRDVHAKVR
jgi:hypothetical protein